MKRLVSFDVGDMLLSKERVLFDKMMLNQEGVIFFEWLKCGRFYEDVSFLIILKIIPHKVW